MKTQPTFVVIAVMALLSALTAFAIDMNLPAIPAIAQDLGDTTEQVQLSISLFLLFFGGGQLFCGPITDSLGRKRVINGGLLLFLLASLSITQVSNYQHLLGWRILQALGGAAISVSVIASLRDMYSGNRLAKMTSYLAMVMLIAPMIAPFIGSVLLQLYNWQSIFLALFALGALGAVLYNTLLPESLKAEDRGPLNLGRSISGYLAVLRDRPSLLYILIVAFSSSPMFIFVTSSPLVYIEYLGVSTQDYPYLFAVNVVAMICHSWLNTRLLSYHSYQRILGVAVWLAVIPALLLLLASLLLPLHLLLWGIAPLMAFIIGLGVLINANASAGLMTRHAVNAGSAASLSGTTRFGAGAVGGILVSIFSTGDQTAMVVAIVLSTLASAGVLTQLKRCPVKVD
jgi:MFS transporter, DHA1 family, multidrug resistance protein